MSNMTVVSIGFTMRKTIAWSVTDQNLRAKSAKNFVFATEQRAALRSARKLSVSSSPSTSLSTNSTRAKSAFPRATRAKSAFPRAKNRQKTAKSALVVEGKVLIVTPNVVITRTSPTPTNTPSPNYSEAQDLVLMATDNLLNPSTSSQVTTGVTTDDDLVSPVHRLNPTTSFNDEYTSSNNEYQRVDYEDLYEEEEDEEDSESPNPKREYFRSKSFADKPRARFSDLSPNSPLDDFSSSPVTFQFNDYGPKNHSQEPRQFIYHSTSRGRKLDSAHSSNADSGVHLQPSHSQQAKSHLQFSVSTPESNVYDTKESTEDITETQEEEQQEQQGGEEEEEMRSKSPQEETVKQTSWGFGPSRSPSRAEPRQQTYSEETTDDDWRFGKDHSPSRRNSSTREPPIPISRAPSRLRNIDDEGYDSEGRRKQQRRRDRQISKDDSRIGLLSDAYDFEKSNVSSRFKEELRSYRAIKIKLFKNGDPWFGGISYRFLPGKIVTSLDSLFRDVGPKLDIINGVSYMYDTEGNRVTSIDEIKDGGEYVCSSSRRFVAANYGATGDSFMLDGLSGPSRSNSRMLKHHPEPRKITSSTSAPSTTGRDSDKPGSGDGRIIRIINYDNKDMSERVLLNLKTSQPFEEVLVDLGQVLKIKHASSMYTREGKEVRSFSQLRNIFPQEDTFIISSGPVVSSSIFDMNENRGRDEYTDDYSRGSKSRLSMRRQNSDPNLNVEEQFPLPPGVRRKGKRGTRDPSPSGEFHNGDPIKVTIKGDRKVFYPPSNGYRRIVNAPSNSLALDWVYGYRGFDVNKNLWVLAKGQLVYFVGNFAIIYDRLEETQRHYTMHTEEIQCMDVQVDRNLAVSGQKSGKTPDTRAHIRLWDLETLETLSVLGFGDYELGVAAVAFSSSSIDDELLIAGIDKASEHIMSVWEWDSGSKNHKLLGRVASHQELIFGVVFHPLDNHLLISYGRNHLTFWNRRKDGFFERSDVVDDTRDVSCVAFLESGDLVAGDSTGCLRVFSVNDEGEYFVSVELEEAHVNKSNSKLDGVGAILVLDDGTLVSGGSKDRMVRTWDSTREFKSLMEIKLPESFGSVRSIQPQSTSDVNLYLGTTNNCLLEGSMARKFSVAVWGHSRRLDAVAVHPDDFAFVTAGFDKVVAKWRKQKVIWKVTVQTECVCIAYHPSGLTVAVGTLDGHLIILNAETGSHVTTARVCGAPVNALEFNKEGDCLALASHNGTVYTYKTSARDGFALKRSSRIATGVSLLHLDWSEDSYHIQTVSLDFNLYFVDLRSSKVERNVVVVRDQTWLDQTCTLGYAAAGTWNNINYKNDPSTTTALNVGNHRTRLAAGDIHGYLRLFQYPCTSPRAEYHEVKPCSSAITGIRFLFEDMYLLSVGGTNATLIRWKIV